MVSSVSSDAIFFSQKSTLPEVCFSEKTHEIFFENGFEELPHTPIEPGLRGKAFSIDSLEEKLKEAEKGKVLNGIWACARALLNTAVVAGTILFITNPWVSIPLGIVAIILGVRSGISADEVKPLGIDEVRRHVSENLPDSLELIVEIAGLLGLAIAFAVLSPISPFYEVSNRIPELEKKIAKRKEELNVDKAWYTSWVERYSRGLEDYIKRVDCLGIERKLEERLEEIQKEVDAIPEEMLGVIYEELDKIHIPIEKYDKGSTYFSRPPPYRTFIADTDERIKKWSEKRQVSWIGRKRYIVLRETYEIRRKKGYELALKELRAAVSKYGSLTA